MMDDRPLAETWRPKEFNHIIGQNKIWAPGMPLRVLVEKDRFFSLIFWGPPGTGKTSIANLIGKHSNRNLISLSAVSCGVKEIRAAIQDSFLGRANILFLDEVHRLNKGQQDVLLPAIEQGEVKFIGATTENPSFEINRAIHSRSLIFKFEKVAAKYIFPLLKHVAAQVPDNILKIISQNADGDVRRALNLLDAVLATGEFNLEKLAEALPIFHDKSGDQHYDVVSAMIKSIRASHPDAAVYYMARMLDAGEDPMFIARRLMIAAAEEVGNANPHALNVATSGAQAVHMVGMPEARIILSQVCTFLASSPKSNRSYLAVDRALAAVRKHKSLEIPMHLRNAPTKMMQDFGHGHGYVYAHDDSEGAKKLSYFPAKLAGSKFYEPISSGYEANICETLGKVRPTED